MSPLRKRRLRRLRLRTIFRIAGWMIVSVYLVFMAIVGFTRLWLFPHIERQIPFIEEQIQNITQTDVNIGHLSADWNWINPRLSIENLTLARPGEAASLTLPRVDATLSWYTLFKLTPTLSRLVVTDPNLKVTRLSDTVFNVAGFEIDTAQSDNAGDDDAQNRTLVHILEAQQHIEIINGQFEYLDLTQDDARTLRVKDTNFLLHQHLIAWSVGFQAKLESPRIDTPIDLRANIERKLFGDSLDPKTWSGRLYVDIDHVDFGPIAKRIGMEQYLQSGKGETHFWLHFKNRKLTKLTADLVLDDVKLRLADGDNHIRLDHLSGRFEETLSGNLFELSTKDVVIKPHGLDTHYLGDTYVSGLWMHGTLNDGSVNIAHIDLNAIAKFVAQLPLPETTKSILQVGQPRGLVENFNASWSGPIQEPTKYEVNAKFEALSFNDSIPLPDSSWQTPGFRNLSGSVEIENGNGEINLDSRGVVLSFPGIFVEKNLDFDELKVQAQWQLKPFFDIRFNKVIANNSYASANVHGGWSAMGGPIGTLEVRGDLHYMQANEVHRYIPLVAGGRSTNDWLKAALRRGIASNGKVNLYGPLHLFPYTNSDNSEHIFQITAQAEGLELDYVPTGKRNEKGEYIPGPWPLISDIKAYLDFKGMGFEIKAQSGKTMGATLSNVYASIPDYTAPYVPLVIRGQGHGPLLSMAQWVNESPVSALLGDVFVGSTASGNADLTLSLDIPILNAVDTKVNGTVTVAGNSLHMHNVPPLTDAHGVVGFSERGVWASHLQAKIFGVDTTGSIKTDEQGKITIFANAPAATMPAVSQIIGVPLVSNILSMGDGHANANVEVTIKNGVQIHVDSDLIGLAFDAPTPFKKEAAQALPLRFDFNICTRNQARCVPTMELDIGKIVDLDFRYAQDANGMHLTHGSVGLNQQAIMPQKSGISLLMNMPKTDWVEWDPFLARLLDGLDTDSDNTEGVMLNVVELTTPKFIFQQLPFNRLTMHADIDRQGRWHGRVVSDDATGNFVWTARDAGGRAHISGQFDRLWVDISNILANIKQSEPKDAAQMPSLDVNIADFRLNEYQLGSVHLNAKNTGKGADWIWQIDDLTVKTPEATLTASGQWNAGKADASSTRIEATLDIDDLGKLLERAKLPKTVQDGHGQIHTTLDWIGSPSQFTISNLNASVSTTLRSGQLLQVEPGAARILSLLSLQSLLRRLTLDFRDVVGEGFVFDTINSNASVNHGVVTSDSFRLVGPQATVVIGGEVDLNQQTQNLLVTVLPDLSFGSSTLALSLVNPIVGVGSFLAQWALQAPLSKLFSLEYSITGTFEDPIVEKVEKTTTTVESSVDP
ncbi:MAG: TIGR02099 family protein [Burkholderiaceae bacterium]|nr:TIGR02099 family protein [Burkholderiaceae bacterium]